MARYSREKKTCETCGHTGKALIKTQFATKWYRCMKCKEIIGKLNDPIFQEKNVLSGERRR